MILREALAESCDTYFYDVGYRYYTRGTDYWTRLQQWARRFGFGADPGLDIGHEEAGLLPTPAWRKRTYKHPIDQAWNPGELIQLAIGQKDLTVTPLQMARFYAVLANGGKLVTPYLVSSVEQPGVNGTPPVLAADLRAEGAAPSMGLDPAAVQAVRDGPLRGHARRRTAPRSASSAASRCRSPARRARPRRSCRCPATRADHQEDQAWWCGWGPSDGSFVGGRPPLVVCALIENGGHGGTSAAPAALRVFEQWFGVEGRAVQQVVATD